MASDRKGFTDRPTEGGPDSETIGLGRRQQEQESRRSESQQAQQDSAARDARRAQQDDVVLPGRQIGPYRILRELGSGGMGQVFLAHDERLDRQVAVKRLLDKVTLSKETHERFRREAQVAARLNHASIVQVYDLVSDGETDCLVMEYVEGTTLRKRLAEVPIELADLVDLCRQIADGMAAAHDAGVIHRDLKTDNILLTRAGKAKIADFGVAKLRGAEALTVDNVVIGTLRAMSPEQALGHYLDHRSDLFSFGTLLYEAFTGTSPFVADNPMALLNRIVNEPHVPARSRLEDAPLRLTNLIDRLLAKDRYMRPRDFHAVVRALTDIYQTLRPYRSEASQATIVIAPVMDDSAPADPAGVDETTAVESEQDGSGAFDALAGDALLRAPARAVGLTDSGEPIPLWGRDEVLGKLVGEAHRCLATGTPVLSTIEASTGLGKTQILYALAVALRDSAEDPHQMLAPARPGSEAGAAQRRNIPTQVNYVRAEASSDARPYTLSRLLLRLALALPSLDVRGGQAMAVLDAAWARLGANPTEPSRWAIAFLLGAAPAHSPHVVAIASTREVLRQTAARGLALALVHAARRQPLLLLLDDIHLGDEIALDAVELATSGNLPQSLGIWATAQPTFFSRRPAWGSRAASGQRHSLPALDRDETRAMLEHLLKAENLPDPLVSRLYELSSGTPLYVAELARAMRDRGLLDRPGFFDPSAGQAVIDTDELLRGTELSVEERLGHQFLRSVPGVLVPLAWLAAVLDCAFTVSDAVEVLGSLPGPPRHGGLPAASMTTGESTQAISAGLDQLCQLGIVERRLGTYVVRNHLLAQAIASAIPSGPKRELHIAVLEYLQETRSGARNHLALHAVASGALDLATRLYLELADESWRNHCYLEAEERYTRALEYLSEEQVERGHALARRAHVRARLQRLDEALTDLREARGLAEARGDDGEQVTLLLQEATLLDWCSQWKSAASVAERALSRVRKLDSDQMLAALHLACGRAHLRREYFADAVELLTSAVRRADASRERETHIEALVCLVPALLYSDRTAEAERRLEEAVSLCESTGDMFHLALAHIGRRGLRLRQNDIERMIEELQAAQLIGRQVGNAQLERMAALHLSEGLYWYGWYDEALAVCERARQLHLESMSGYPSYEDHLLLARIHCSLGRSEARGHLRWLDDNCVVGSYVPSARAQVAFVRLAVIALEDGDYHRHAWRAVEQRLRGHPNRALYVELLVMAAEVLADIDNMEEARVWWQEAREAAGTSVLWQPRLDALARQLA